MSDFRTRVWRRKIEVRNRLIKAINTLEGVDRERLLGEYRKLYSAVVRKTKLCENCP